MKKRVLGIVLATAMAATLLIGCGSTAPTEEAADAATEETAEAGDDAAADTAAGDVSALKVGVICNTTETDGGWCQAQSVGYHAAAEKLGMSEDQMIFLEGISEETVAVTNAVEMLIDEEGCNVICGASTGYSPILSELATQYTDVQFCQVGAANSNLICYQMRDYEGMFLLGYLCACMDETGKLGYSAGMSEASVRRGINAFSLGAKYKNPDATVEVVWANSWYDPEAETNCANSLISAGHKYIGINASSPAIAEACEKAGIFMTGYHVDMHDYAPNACMVSYVWNWAPIIEDMFTKIAAADAPYEDAYFWGSEYDCPQITDFNADIVPEDVAAEVLDVQQKILSGEIDVYGGELKDNEGNVLVEDGSTMSDEDIMNQEFLVENVIGSWK